jgi:hypothetical protein
MISIGGMPFGSWAFGGGQPPKPARTGGSLNRRDACCNPKPVYAGCQTLGDLPYRGPRFPGFYGLLWASVGLCWPLWVSVGLCGPLWASVGLCGSAKTELYRSTLGCSAVLGNPVGGSRGASAPLPNPNSSLEFRV